MLYTDGHENHTYELFTYDELTPDAQEHVYNVFNRDAWDTFEFELNSVYDDVHSAIEWFNAKATNAHENPFKWYYMNDGIFVNDPIECYDGQGLINDFYELEPDACAFNNECFMYEIMDAWNSHIARIQAACKKLSHYEEVAYTACKSYNSNEWDHAKSSKASKKQDVYEQAANSAIKTALEDVAQVISGYIDAAIDYYGSREAMEEYFNYADEMPLFDKDGNEIARQGFGAIYHINHLEELFELELDTDQKTA